MKKPARKAGTTRRIEGLAELDRLACACARELGFTKVIVHLEGPLGVGKTTFVRYWLQHLSIPDSVRSPSFTLLECYEREGQRIVHTDLFRLRGASELENLGLRDYVGEALIFIEWPERGEWATPPPDIRFVFAYSDTGRSVCIESSGGLEIPEPGGHQSGSG